MKTYNWDLNKIYNGFDSKEFSDDYQKVEDLIQKINDIDVSEKSNLNVFKNIYKYLLEAEKISYELGLYTELNLSVNQENNDALKAYGKLQKLSEGFALPSVKLEKYVKEYDNFLEDVLKDDELSNYEYSLKKLEDSAKRMLSDETEILLAKLKRSSSSAWEMLFSNLTSTLEVEYDDKIITLSEVRNLAYSSDQNVRKKAYEAELKAYKNIERPLAATLSSIKQETTTMAKERGYKSGLDRTLKNSGMTEKTLDALTGAIEKYYPVFRSYLKRKGKVLGDENGCPFYDLFAPMGRITKEYTIEEANKYLVDRFSTFNKEISSMMKRAMENNWIDYLPKASKVGGAFCAGSVKTKESRILTNFDGSFNSICTLAHELGHAYHNEVLKDAPFEYNEYPMQLAETASTFNETFIKDYAMKNSKDNDELLNILEASISDDTQVIVDIMSRFYFEKEVFKRSDEAQLTKDELKEIMINAQLKSYGDGLDKEYLHPYMWCCKGHYYSTGLSYYNFPYAFGQLFAYGLYSIYEEKGESFFELYKKVLYNAGRMPIRECVLEAGIDVEKQEFWEKSLDLIKNKIDKFLELTE